MHVMVILFVGSLALAAECRLEAGRRSHLDGGDNNTSSSNSVTLNNSISSLDDARFSLICCRPARSCSSGDCYCCPLLKPTACFKTLEDCKSKCPKCDPKCPSESTMELHA
ncbi:hypothetical protein TRIUR3_17873 [Triticum urartu]|uniref:Uncharacterized protein n=1 Tax=Triticum urartu TaxID=4572 RepID=M8A721_TRIUA|nr:hypothetical protein TRIUR3_17873 [Triticum urartu]